MYHVELMVQGRLDAHWSDWMGGLQITYSEPAVTRLAGVLPDQPALYAVISQLASLNLELITVRCETQVDHPGQANITEDEARA